MDKDAGTSQPTLAAMPTPAGDHASGDAGRREHATTQNRAAGKPTIASRHCRPVGRQQCLRS